MAANSTRITTIKRFHIQGGDGVLELLDTDWEGDGEEPGLTIRYQHIKLDADSTEILLSLDAVDAIMFRAALRDLFGGTL